MSVLEQSRFTWQGDDLSYDMLHILGKNGLPIAWIDPWGTPGGNLAGTGGSGTPGGSSGQIQFNDSDTFSGDSQFTWDNTGKKLYAGPAFSSFNAEMQAYSFHDPATSLHAGIVGTTISAEVNSRPSGGYFLAQGNSAIAVEGFSINSNFALGNAGGDVNGGQFVGLYHSTVTTVRGATGINGYAYVYSDAGHTNGGAVGVIGYANNAGAGSPFSSGYPLASFITYGNEAATGTVIPLNVGYEVYDDMSELGGGTATLSAAFYASAQSTYGVYIAGGRNHLGSVTGDPSSGLENGDYWYNSVMNRFRCRENGVTVNMTAG